MSLSLRRIGLDDAALLDRVADDVFDDVISPARLAAFLADDRSLMVLAIEDGLVVGQARGIIHRSPDQPDELYIDNMGVAPYWRRQGIGGRLLDELLAWGRERECDFVWLGTEVDNIEAQALYASGGMRRELIAMYDKEL